MTKAEDELDEFGKRTLASLRATPPLDSQVIMEVKANYLMEGENLRQAINSESSAKDTRQEKNTIFGVLQRKPIMKALVAVVLAFVVLLAGSSFTVFASQGSLPGEVLYPVKSWSEDVRLSLTSSPSDRLVLTLYFTNLRMEEISTLMARGNQVSAQTTDRFQRELEDALQLAAQLDDTQIQYALGEIKSQAEKQGITIQELISKLPPQAEPAVLKLQERLNEQVQLSNIGEANPKNFRAQINERREKLKGPKHSPDTDQSQSPSDKTTTTAIPSEEGNNHGNKMNQPTEEPGQIGSGNGNHGPIPSHTPKP
jgi:Domain of unknown function (DUF5667)